MLANEDIVKKWIQAFGANVPKEIIKNHVTESGNFLWYIFGWGKVSFLQGDEARKTLDSFSSKQKCILFHNGYSINGKTKSRIYHCVLSYPLLKWTSCKKNKIF